MPRKTDSPTRNKENSSSKKQLRAPRRSKPAPPLIFIERSVNGYRHHMSRAHLRNKRGYVYLCWREGKRVRTFYLGKAPRPSPTPDPRSETSGRPELSSHRRAK